MAASAAGGRGAVSHATTTFSRSAPHPAALAAAAWRSADSSAREAADAPLTVTQLAERLWLISGAGGNVTVFQSEPACCWSMAARPRIRSACWPRCRSSRARARVHTLFNTHWHHDQTGSNQALGKAGTRIIAHENTRLWLTTDVDSKWEGQRVPAVAEDRAAQPDLLHRRALQFGGEQIDYGYLPQAHTDGDIYVYFRNANVLVGADVLAAGAFPIIDYSPMAGSAAWSTPCRRLLELAGAAHEVVAGTGRAAGSRAAEGRAHHAQYAEAAAVEDDRQGQERRRDDRGAAREGIRG